MDMMELWKDTFHDSSRYIEIVFDNYFTLDNVFTRYDENRLIAALMCVPYEFQILMKGRDKTTINAMYLCGLATRQEYRRQGIMSELMKEAERSAKERGFNMTFLIPADSHLREYYKGKGYRNASFRRRERIRISESKEEGKLNIYSIRDLFEKDCLKIIEQLADWCVNIDKEERRCSTIIHSRKDIIAAMKENENSIFLTDRTFDLKNPNLAKVRAVVFPEWRIDSLGRKYVVLAALYDKTLDHDNTQDKYNGIVGDKEVVRSVCNFYSGLTIEQIVPFEGMQTPREGEEPYAMAKTLIANENSNENENPTLKIFLMLD